MKTREKSPMVGGPSQKTGSFGDGLAGAARSIVADARAAIASPDLPDAEAVHEVRKALKRWRALMRLLVHAVGEPADQMRIEARDLMRALSGARDLQSAMDAVADLSKSGHTISPTSIESIRKRLAELRDAAEAVSFTTEMRERLSLYLDKAEQSAELWQLDGIGFDVVTEGLTATYRRARKLVPAHWQEASAEDLHDLRRRVVEHRHQMDLVEPLWPRLGQVWAEEAQRLRNQLGACQDLAVLTQLTAPHQPLARWRSRLAPAVADRHTRHIKNAARLAARLFAEKPKAFRKRIEALWSARQTKKR